MKSPSMKDMLDPWMIPVLRAMGKTKWLSWKPYKEADGIPRTQVQLGGMTMSVHTSMKQQFDTMWRLLKKLGEVDCNSLFHFYMLSKSLAEGPKVLRPTDEQCEALENVDVNVSFDDYEQPFPVVHIQLPEKYKAKITEQFGIECPPFVSLFHDKATKYIVCCTEVGMERSGQSCVMGPSYPIIETALRFRMDEGNDLTMAEHLHRVAVNFGLMLTCFGVRECPEDPQIVKDRQALSDPNKIKRRKAAERLSSMMNEITFSQQVQFYSTEGNREHEAAGIGAPRKTHWRRGHFRRQHYGKSNAFSKTIFIRPVLVKASEFKGDVANTEYTING